MFCGNLLRIELKSPRYTVRNSKTIGCQRKCYANTLRQVNANDDETEYSRGVGRLKSTNEICNSLSQNCSTNSNSFTTKQRLTLSENSDDNKFLLKTTTNNNNFLVTTTNNNKTNNNLIVTKNNKNVLTTSNNNNNVVTLHKPQILSNNENYGTIQRSLIKQQQLMNSNNYSTLQLSKQSPTTGRQLINEFERSFYNNNIEQQQKRSSQPLINNNNILTQINRMNTSIHNDEKLTTFGGKSARSAFFNGNSGRDSGVIGVISDGSTTTTTTSPIQSEKSATTSPTLPPLLTTNTFLPLGLRQEPPSPAKTKIICDEDGRLSEGYTSEECEQNVITIKLKDKNDETTTIDQLGHPLVSVV